MLAITDITLTVCSDSSSLSASMLDLLHMQKTEPNAHMAHTCTGSRTHKAATQLSQKMPLIEL